MRYLLPFYVGYVIVNFLVTVYLFISSVLTVYTTLPLPYFLLYIPNNIAIAALALLIVILSLYVYLGVSLIRHSLNRGILPLVFAASIALAIITLVLRIFVAAVVFLVIAIAGLLGTFGVLISISNWKPAKALWALALILTIASVLAALAYHAVLSYVATATQAMVILACALESYRLFSMPVTKS